MRHIPASILKSQIFADDEGKMVKARLTKAHKKLARMKPSKRKKHIGENGSNKWKPVKERLTNVLGKKCWYTEVELIGAPLVIDHFRPVCSYWWLTYDPENYRVACAWANSSEHNATHGCAGGKVDKFPLGLPGIRAKGKNRIRIERPIVLDPCNAADCELLAFQTDGRPVLNPKFAGNKGAKGRVEASKLLLNLDHPDFNTKREQLYLRISEDVRNYEALPSESAQRVVIWLRLKASVAPTAPFSIAARFYLSLNRHLHWVGAMLKRA